MGGSRGGGGDKRSGSPLEKSQKYRVFSNTGPDFLKITKLSSQHSVLGHHRHARETPKMVLCWRANDDPLIVVFGSSLPLSTKKKKKKKKRKNVVKVGPPLTKLSGSAHVI